MKLTHLLFTRFNIQYEPNDSIGIQPDWLEERLRLFELYCLPSIQKQTCQDFIWVLLGDIRTPENYKLQIEHYTVLLPQIRTCWLPYQEDGYHSCYKQIAQDLAKDADKLISTRLDSDDTLSSDYIEHVQEIAKRGTRGMITFPHGKQTFTKDHKSFEIRYIQNHFLSRIEDSGYDTIMVFDHSLVQKSALQIFETEQPMWDEVVHGGNIHNDFEPKYQYIIHGWKEFIEISRRWFVFRLKHVLRSSKSLFVRSHEG